MDKFIDNLKRQAEENPILALGITAGLITALSKLMDSTAGVKNAKAWAKEVDRRDMKDRLKN